MRSAINPADHAFADGAVFQQPKSMDEARKILAQNDEHIASGNYQASLLLSIWTRFSKAAQVSDKVSLGLGARLINGNQPESVIIEGPSAVRGILRAETNGHIHIGRFVYIGDNTIISSHKSIQIGYATLIAHGVQIFDNDSHPTHAYQREIQFRRMLGDKSEYVELEIKAAPVTIGKRCWIGLNSLILKGVTIGDNTIVAANSVVTSDLPPGVIAVGNPAKVVRKLHPEELENT